MKITDVGVNVITPSRHQNRVEPTPDSLRSLADSITEQGILEPVIVRKLDDAAPDGPLFELVAGERRWRAAILANKKTIPAIVRKMNDQEAALATVTENMEREDLNPLEEARGVQTLMEVYDGDAKAAADRLRTTPRWIRRRASLLNLSESWVAAADNPESAISGWAPAHLEVISRLPKEQQELIYRVDFRYGVPARPTVDMLESTVGSRLKSLAAAPWDTNDGNLTEAPACSKCPLRSDHQPDLFEEFNRKEDKDPRCLDSRCWDEKADAHIAAALKANPDAVRVRTVWHYAGGRDTPEYAKGATHVHDLEKTTRKAGGVRCIYVDGHQAGLTFYGKVLRSEVSSDAKAGPKTLAQRRVALERRRWKLVGEQIAALLEKAPPPPIETLVTLAAAIGTYQRSEHPGSGNLTMDRTHQNAWAYHDSITDETILRALWAMIKPCLIGRLGYGSHVALETLIEEARRVGAVVGDDVEERYAAVARAKPEPKSWAKLNEDGTPKKKAKSAV